MKSKDDVVQLSRRRGLQFAQRASAVVVLSAAMVASGIAQSHWNPTANRARIADRAPAHFGVRGACTVGPPPRDNGIAATPKGDELILVHMSEGRLYLLDTATHVPVPIDISGGDFAGGAALCSTDGILLGGHTLYAVQAALNRVAVVRMAPDHLSGVVTRYITEPFASNPALSFPTTIASFGNALYAVTCDNCWTRVSFHFRS